MAIRVFAGKIKRSSLRLAFLIQSAKIDTSATAPLDHERQRNVQAAERKIRQTYPPSSGARAIEHLLGDDNVALCRPRARLRVSVAVAFFPLLLWTAAAVGQTLIAHEDSPGTELSQSQARLLFTQRVKVWPNGTPVKVFVFPDEHPLHNNFSKKVLGIFPYLLRRVWDRQIFSGTGQAPTAVSTEDEMIQGVSSTPGAIGYIDTELEKPGVRKVMVR